MNRRSFFRTLAAAAPAIFVPQLIKPAWKAIKPAFVTQPFQEVFIGYCVEDSLLGEFVYMKANITKGQWEVFVKEHGDQNWVKSHEETIWQTETPN